MGDTGTVNGGWKRASAKKAQGERSREQESDGSREGASRGKQKRSWLSGPRVVWDSRRDEPVDGKPGDICMRFVRCEQDGKNEIATEQCVRSMGGVEKSTGVIASALRKLLWRIVRLCQAAKLLPLLDSYIRTSSRSVWSGARSSQPASFVLS